jgi:transcriptional regulator with AAA-type ATPase domain
LTRNQNNLDTVPAPEDTQSTGLRRQQQRDDVIGLLVLWDTDEPNTLGSFLPLRANRAQTYVLGRGGSQQERTECARTELVRQRPNRNEPQPPFESPSLSRTQLLIRAESPQRLELTNAGRRRLFVNGTATESQCVSPGDIIELGPQLTLMCVTRPSQFQMHPGIVGHEFGEPDAQGMIGESQAMWKLRREIAHVARRSGNVLIVGNAGTGKKLTATAIHTLSGRTGPLIACDMAKLTQDLAQAELFGNIAGYPNPSEPERKGLIGAANRGTLFLDGFSELPANVQGDVLRAIQSGTYRRLGEDSLRRSNLRLIAATHRPDSTLRQDVAARFEFRLHTPRLEERREDIPLLALHFLYSMQSDEDSLSRLFAPNGLPRFATGFVRRLVRHPWNGQVRELRELLQFAASHSTGEWLEWPDQPLPSHSGSTGSVESVEPDPTTRDEFEWMSDSHHRTTDKSSHAPGLTKGHAAAGDLAPTTPPRRT